MCFAWCLRHLELKERDGGRATTFWLRVMHCYRPLAGILEGRWWVPQEKAFASQHHMGGQVSRAKVSLGRWLL